jgi:hypothetical protein
MRIQVNSMLKWKLTAAFITLIFCSSTGEIGGTGLGSPALSKRGKINAQPAIASQTNPANIEWRYSVTWFCLARPCFYRDGSSHEAASEELCIRRKC